MPHSAWAEGSRGQRTRTRRRSGLSARHCPHPRRAPRTRARSRNRTVALPRSIADGGPAVLLALDGVSAERRVLFANLERRLIVRTVVPLVHRFEAFPSLDRYSLRRCARNCGHWLRSGSWGPPDGDEAGRQFLA